MDMSEVNDDMFSQKMMGDGVAIESDGETVTAPGDYPQMKKHEDAEVVANETPVLMF